MIEIEKIQTELLAQNCWILSSENAAVVIDPGCAAEKILAKVERAEIAAILLTHNHSDHRFGLAELFERTRAPIFVHSADAEVVEKNWLAIKNVRRNGDKIILPTEPVTDGEILEIGKMKIGIIHTPGHSPGSVCFRVDGELFSGDTLFRENVGRTDLAGGDTEKLRMSVAKLLELPGETIVRPGHGENWTIGAAQDFRQKTGLF